MALKPTGSTRSSTRRKSDRLAARLTHPDMSRMKNLLFASCIAAAVVLNAVAAVAQIIPPAGPPVIPPPPPLPGPKIQVPVVPKMDELPSRNYVPAPRPSFSDKVTTCLEEGAAAGLGAADRAAYARACANSR